MLHSKAAAETAATEATVAAVAAAATAVVTAASAAAAAAAARESSSNDGQHARANRKRHDAAIQTRQKRTDWPNAPGGRVPSTATYEYGISTRNGSLLSHNRGAWGARHNCVRFEESPI